MGNADWSLDQLEQDLADGFALLGRSERRGGLGAGESSAFADGVMRCMNGALMKVSESLEAQASLRRELDCERLERQRARDEHDRRIRNLEDEIQALRKCLEQEREWSRTALSRLDAGAVRLSPSEEYLSRPLVLRSQQGDFLGVTDRAGLALTLAGFLRLVEGQGAAPRMLGTCWEADAEGWRLLVSVSAPRPRCHSLVTRPWLTPSGNRVTLLESLAVDGRAVPQEYALQMFRQLRESMQEQ